PAAAGPKSAILPPMRAPLPRAFLCVAALVAAPLACTKNNPNTNVKIANGEGDGAAESARAPGAPTRPTPRTDLQKTRMSGSVVGVADMLDAARKLITMWSPPEPGAPAVNLQSMLEVL